MMYIWKGDCHMVGGGGLKICNMSANLFFFNKGSIPDIKTNRGLTKINRAN